MSLESTKSAAASMDLDLSMLPRLAQSERIYNRFVQPVATKAVLAVNSAAGKELIEVTVPTTILSFGQKMTRALETRLVNQPAALGEDAGKLQTFGHKIHEMMADSDAVAVDVSTAVNFVFLAVKKFANFLAPAYLGADLAASFVVGVANAIVTPIVRGAVGTVAFTLLLVWNILKLIAKALGAVALGIYSLICLICRGIHNICRAIAGSAEKESMAMSQVVQALRIATAEEQEEPSNEEILALIPNVDGGQKAVIERALNGATRAGNAQLVELCNSLLTSLKPAKAAAPVSVGTDLLDLAADYDSPVAASAGLSISCAGQGTQAEGPKRPAIGSPRPAAGAAVKAAEPFVFFRPATKPAAAAASAV
ncbi:MAG: hypothetical protein HYX48_05525 [Chlamydiales bacterium]|nr:hypothetical protein [Chlamydiales bacterium]